MVSKPIDNENRTDYLSTAALMLSKCYSVVICQDDISNTEQPQICKEIATLCERLSRVLSASGRFIRLIASSNFGWRDHTV